jgi:hypothetical protein
MVEIKSTRDLGKLTADDFTSVGSYTLIVTLSNGDEAHPRCIRKRFVHYARALKQAQRWDAYPRWLSTYDEGPALECCECGEPIESSYGDPDAPTHDEIAEDAWKLTFDDSDLTLAEDDS